MEYKEKMLDDALNVTGTLSMFPIWFSWKQVLFHVLQISKILIFGRKKGFFMPSNTVLHTQMNVTS